MNTIEAHSGSGRLRVWGAATLCGNYVNIALMGGEQPHIGAVSLAVYEPDRSSATVSTITVYRHRDDVCASACAKLVATELQCVATVSVGIHIDNPASEELSVLFQTCMACCSLLIKRILEDRMSSLSPLSQP